MYLDLASSVSKAAKPVHGFSTLAVTFFTLSMYQIATKSALQSSAQSSVRVTLITRSTSTSSHQLAERLVVLPDKPNVLARRVQIRPQHSPNFVKLHNEGYVSWAGPLFKEHVDKPISERPFKGSAMVVNEESWSGFMKTIGSDPYVKEGIWDLEKTQFIPFRTLFRIGNEGK